MRISRHIRVVVAALSLVGAGAALVVAAPPASAGPSAPDTSAGSAALRHGDACGPRALPQVPDSGPVFNFHSACHWHDGCYADKPYGASDAGRARCDWGFFTRMNNSCHDRYPRWYQTPLRAACNQIGQDYYYAVVAFGEPAFWLA